MTSTNSTATTAIGKPSRPLADPIPPGGNRCQTCGASKQFLIQIWINPLDRAAGNPPDYVECTECETAREVKRDADIK